MCQWYSQSSSYQCFFSNVSCLASWPWWNAESHELVLEDLKPGYSEYGINNIQMEISNHVGTKTNQGFILNHSISLMRGLAQGEYSHST